MEHLWTMAANQGFSVLLLTVIVYYFYQRQNAWEKKIEELHEKRNAERVELVQLTEELKQVIQQNTQTLDAIKLLINDRSKAK